MKIKVYQLYMERAFTKTCSLKPIRSREFIKIKFNSYTGWDIVKNSSLNPILNKALLRIKNSYAE